MYPTIVITAAVPWDGIIARPHHLARQLASRGWPILFVEPPVTLIGPFRNPALRDRMLPKNPIQDVERDTVGHIRILQPMTTLPFYHVARPVNRFNQRLLARQIRQHEAGPLVLFSNLPGSVDLIPWLRPIATFYDCVDDHGAFGGLTRSDVIESLEADMSYQSRAVFATADALVEKMALYHNDVHLVPNAVELDHFRTAASATPHPELSDIKGPRVGFIGGIGAWLDFDFLHQLATSRSDVQFVFIGPVEADVSKIRSLPNVHFLGRKPYTALPQFLAGFDACLYPFANSKLTESVNPVKVYEYLAADKEVIATPTRELNKFSQHVWLTPDATAAENALAAILSGEKRSTMAEREPFLREQTWSARATQIESILLHHLPGNRAH
ncbi:glycosyltransferase [Alicyclobacillus acidoterrestris]|uniref:Glycosyltransferase n=1 Tax=Alicyclobacillus acidoterrestris (strain ATCC 49025 / DSM 3922 / CIP 106132 / NCIMB 13137 / GD3B) TaxID=1356854 RepID=T0BL15_ALIAG|nr:glycosyltransferase [Alicyclobacillus acidoterrestris]EPZ44678.1 hypothetical protein N007_10600 [Alicyclobacillus acidoterrestris ATCC 49025]UNO50306.1 glycosyltransferase [Alicyclobacillus acidoterrestris]